MIKIKVNDEKTYGFDREELEGKILQSGLDIFNSEELNPMIRQTVKSTLGLVLGIMKIHKPKELEEMDNLEFALRFATDQLLTRLEESEIEIKAYEIKEEEGE